MSNQVQPPAVTANPDILIDRAVEAEISNRLVEMTITDSQTGLYRCEALFENWGVIDDEYTYVLSESDLLNFGNLFSVAYGPDDTSLFTGYIMGLEGLFLANGSRLLRVLAEDSFQDLRMTRRTRHFGDDSTVTTDAVLQEIADGHGMQTNLDIEAISHKRLTQVNESDLAFLRRLARMLDADLWFEDNTLHMVTRSRHGGQAKVLTYQQELLEFVVLADLAEQRTEVKVSGWNAANKEKIEAPAKRDVIGAELGTLTSGAEILENAFGERVETIAHRVPLDYSEAETQAKAAMQARARRFVTGTAIVKTAGRYRVGDKVQFTKLDKYFNGDYIVTGVQHLYDSSGGGMRTELLVERPGIEY